MTLFNLSVSNTVGNHQNKLFPNYNLIEDVQTLLDATTYDHSPANFQNNERLNENFIESNVIVIDFDYKENKTIAQFLLQHRQYEFYIVPSRNHQKVKESEGKREEACDRYHVYFPLNKSYNKEQYEELLNKFVIKFGSDKGAKGAARFFFGNSNLTINDITYNEGNNDLLIEDVFNFVEENTIIKSNKIDKKITKKMTFNSEEDLILFSNKIIDKTIVEIQNACSGERNSLLFKNACYLVKLSNGNFPIDMDDIESKLFDAGVGCGLSASEVNVTLKSAFKIKDKISYKIDENSKVIKKQKDIIKRTEELIKEKYKLRKNSITDIEEYELNGHYYPMDDGIYHSMYIDMLGHFELNNLKANVFNSCLQKIANDNKVNPLIEQIKSFEPNEDHFNAVLNVLHLTNEDHRERVNNCFKKWLVRTIGCIFAPQYKGINNEIVPILVGVQGNGKTSFIERLSFNNKYYKKVDSLRFDKDDLIDLSQNVIINLDEMQNANNSDYNRLKAYISNSHINIRKPYGRYSTTLNRIAGVIGSNNHKEFLSDSTGNRRFFPIEVDSVDSFSLTQEQIEGFWGWGYKLFKEGFKGYFSNNEDLQEWDEIKDEFRVISEEEELATLYLCKSEEYTKTRTQIQGYLENLHSKNLRKNNVSYALSHLGINSIVKKIDGKSIRLYNCTFLNDDEGQ